MFTFCLQITFIFFVILILNVLANYTFIRYCIDNQLNERKRNRQILTSLFINSVYHHLLLDTEQSYIQYSINYTTYLGIIQKKSYRLIGFIIIMISHIYFVPFCFFSDKTHLFSLET